MIEDIAGPRARMQALSREEGAGMLTLGRRVGEKVVLTLPDGGVVTLTVLAVWRGRVRLGVSCPPNIPIFRGERLERSPENERRPTTQ
jgi:carbon storage regulator CsrA